MRRLFQRVCTRDYRTRLAVAKRPLAQQAPALPRAKLQAVLFSQVSRHGLPIPKIARQPHLTRFASHNTLQIGDLIRLQLRWPPAARPLLQSCQPIFFEAFHPVSDRAWCVPKQIRHLAAVQ